MRQAISLALISTMIVSGCATQAPMRVVSNPGLMPHDQTQAPPQVWRQFAEKLQVGSLVRVRTSDGPAQTGTLLVVEEDAITLNPKTRISEPARRIRFDVIVEIEPVREGAQQLAKAVAIGAGVGGATFLGLLMLLAASWD